MLSAGNLVREAVALASAVVLVLIVWGGVAVPTGVSADVVGVLF
jgi:hypothetical protein